jgi:hypothetical protein
MVLMNSIHRYQVSSPDDWNSNLDDKAVLDGWMEEVSPNMRMSST